ncbi:MAG: hypothetical protein GY834_10895 [Bacteroidetes bacterium]|nr:hypothetical protein [Bacteroidota bacterium]
MGDIHRIFVIDELDWYYISKRNTVVDQVKSIYQDAELEADIPFMMIFNIDKCDLKRFAEGKITCDTIKYQSDTELYNIYDLYRKYNMESPKFDMGEY